MKIFITGVAGFLGSHLAKRMIDLGHEASGNDNLIGGEKSNLPEKIKFFETDCNDLEKMSDIIKGNEIIYHCAATAHEGLSVFSPNIITFGPKKNSFGLPEDGLEVDRKTLTAGYRSDRDWQCTIKDLDTSENVF